MNCRLFVALYVILSLLFCPIFVFFGLAQAIITVFQLFVLEVNQLLAGIFGLGVSDLLMVGFICLYGVGYGFIFYKLARFAFYVSMCFKSPRIQVVFQGGTLSVLILLSFLRVLCTSSTLEGENKFYNFWELFQKQIALIQESRSYLFK